MTQEELLDKMEKTMHLQSADRKRASQIFSAVEGMSIWEAKELLQRCISSFELLDIRYKCSFGSTTS